MHLRGPHALRTPKNLDSAKLLPRRARQHASFGADTRVAGWTLGGEAQVSGQRYDYVTNKTRLGGYTLLNLYASTRLARDYQVLARLERAGLELCAHRLNKKEDPS